MATETIDVKTPTMSLSNNGTTYLFDTTAPVGVAPAASYTTRGHGVAMASSAVGPERQKYQGISKIITSVYTTGQNVTLKLDTLLDGAWVNAYSVTVTAGTPLERVWDVGGVECRAYVENGATGPTTSASALKLVMNDRGGA